MEHIICKKCHKPFSGEDYNKCKCPYDEQMEEQLREERSKILKNETKNFGYKGKECSTKTIPKIRNSKLINGW